MFPNEIPGNGLRLRLLAPADVPVLFPILNAPEVIAATSSEGWTLGGMEQWVSEIAAAAESGEWCRYGVLLNGTDAVCGDIGLYHVDKRNQRAEVGYELSPDQWGSGVMTRAASALLTWAFANGFHRIEATVLEGNTRSEGVLRKLGFEREATLRDYKWVRGEFRDFSLWSLLATED
jgi:ribosomal-protein-alanine N-acetyltransferase